MYGCMPLKQQLIEAAEGASMITLKVVLHYRVDLITVVA